MDKAGSRESSNTTKPEVETPGMPTSFGNKKKGSIGAFS